MPLIEPLKLPSAELAELHVRYARRKTKTLLELLFRAHAPLAIALARRFSVHHNHSCDLKMAAFRGLLEALNRYDPRLGKFTTFAYWWILKFILKEREFDQNLVRIPLNLVRKHRKIRQLIVAGAPMKTVAARMKLPLAAVETLYSLYDHPHCVTLEEEELIEESSGSPYNCPDQLERLAHFLDTLPPKPRLAVTLRFQTAENRTFADIGRRMKCSPSMAARHYYQGINLLRQKIHRHG